MKQTNRRSRFLATMRPERRRALRSVLVVVSLALSLLTPLSALAETRLLRWQHSEPSTVDGFLIVRGTAAGEYLDERDIGLPAPTNGVYSYDVELFDAPATHVAVRAYNADGASAPSNSRVFSTGTVPDPPPAPAPDPPPDTSLDDTARIFPAASGALMSESFADPLSSDWLQTRAENSLVQTSGLFEIGGVAGTNALSTQSAATNIHAHYLPTGASNWSDYELRGRVYVSSQSGGVGVTVFSDYPNSDSYYRLRRKAQSGAAFELSAHPDASATLTCSAPSTGVVPAAGAWYVFRLRAVDTGSSTIVDAKVWRQGASEPSIWQASCDDFGSRRLTGGGIGVWSMGDGLKAWDDLEVVPAGSAPPPTGQEPLSPPVLLEPLPVQ